MLAVAVDTWGLSLVGVVVGVAVGHLSGRAADHRRLSEEDARRWLNDRRTLYAHYLAVITGFENDCSDTACFLPYKRGDPFDDDVRQFIGDETLELFVRWQDDITPGLTEIELMASPKVSDLAARAAFAIYQSAPSVQYPGTDREQIVPTSYGDYWPSSQCARDLIDLLRNAMRVELGLEPVQNMALTDADWPWLPSQRATLEHYEQQQSHSRAKRRHPSFEVGN